MGIFTKKTKKIASILLILSLISLIPLFSGCNNGSAKNGEEDIGNGEIVPEEPTIHKVGFIYRGSVGNSTHNLIWENGRIQLERNLGVETYYIEDVFVKNFMEAVELLIERGVTVIVSTCHSFANITERAANENRDIDFISFGGKTAQFNLASFQPLLYQPANISGLAAALNTDASSIGIVADNRMFNSAGVINAYIEGAKDVLEPNLTTYVNYVSSDSEREIRQAVDDLVSKGNDVIMLYLGSDYGIKYCESIGVNVVAYSGNLPNLAPDNYITGFYFNVDSYLTEQVRFIQNDIFFPQVTVGWLETGSSQLIRLNSTVSDETVELTELLFSSLIRNDRVFMGQIIDRFGTVQVEHGVTLSYTDVLAIDWLDASASGNNVTSFTEPVAEVALIPLVVKGSPLPPAESESATSTEEEQE
ncbi:MAG: BMP family ABC transporter substrate-binding protein [Oscillospiraceae bacterium]|nr:BMP family ABC transporter substrate-binding protein [Oscillospiraceae bacterium]